MVKEEQQKQSRHLERGSDRAKKAPVNGGGPVPDPNGADSVGIIDPRDLTQEGQHPLSNRPWRPNEDRIAV